MIRKSPSAVRRGARAALAVVAGTALAAGISATAVAATPAPATAAPTANPYDPAYQQPYRHGVVPTIDGLAKMKAWQASHPTHAAATTAATGPQTLSYGGGTNSVGVENGHSKVYLVFYGTQWGTQSTDAHGNATFSGDPSGAAGAAQNFFKGIGTGGELWSADLTQWCQGIATGATSCPAGTPASSFVPYQSGGVLSGIWYDSSAASPAAATGHDLGVEAVSAAAHFGNTTAASNRDAYYVIMSPTGTDPDNYKGSLLSPGYCAWHTWNGDTSLPGGPVSSPYGNFAFSNQPYNIDQGQTCGVSFINSGSAGTLDGYTMTLGHEWHEMMSDQFPAGGWTNPNSSPPGAENSDECAWLRPGTTGGAAMIAFPTGTFAEQSSWSNDTNSCAMSHPIVGHGGTGGSNTVTVTGPGSQTGTVGTAVSLKISATDSASGQTLTYSATGLPAGLSINASTGLISGTPTTAGTSSTTVTATDGTGASGSATFTWTVSSQGGGGGGCTAAQLLVNPGFETGSAAPWTGTTGSIMPSSVGPAHSGNYFAWLDGYGYANTDTVAQSVTIPASCKKATVSFWRYINTQELTTTNVDDTLTVQVLNSSGKVMATLHTDSNLDANNTYTQESYSLNSFIGQNITLKFTATETDADYGTTNFLLDDTALNVS